MCITGLTAGSSKHWRCFMAMQWPGCSSMVRADAVVAQGQAQVPEIMLICTKPIWFHWEPSQSKAHLSGMKARGSGWHSHSPGGDSVPGHTRVMSQVKSLIHQRLFLRPCVAHLTSSGGLAEKGALCFQLPPDLGTAGAGGTLGMRNFPSWSGHCGAGPAQGTPSFILFEQDPWYVLKIKIGGLVIWVLC